MVAKNMNELEQMLLKEMKKAMNESSEKMLADMREETEDFYDQTTPKIYERTHALERTPKTTTPAISGKSVSFDAYLDTNHTYISGDNPTMEQVLNLANYGVEKAWTTKSGKRANPTIGRKGFWERAENKMGKTLIRSMKKYFK